MNNKKVKIKKNGVDMFSGENIECMLGWLKGVSVDEESYLIELVNGREVVVRDGGFVSGWWNRE